MDEKQQTFLEVVKNNIWSIVKSVPTRVTLSTLEDFYLHIIGEPIPFMKFKYPNLISFLREACADTLEIDDDPTNPIVRVTSTDNNSPALVLNQVPKRKQATKPVQRAGSDCRPQSMQNQEWTTVQRAGNDCRLQSMHNQEWTTVQRAGNGCRPQSMQKHGNNIYQRAGIGCRPQTQMNNVDAPQPGRSEGTNKTFNRNKPRRTRSSQTYRRALERGSGGESLTAYNNLLEITRANLSLLVRCYPEGIAYTQLERLYRDKFKKELCYKSLGFRTLLGMCYGFEDILYMFRPSPRSELVLADPRLPKQSAMRQRRQAALARPQPAESRSETRDEAQPGVSIMSVPCHLCLPERGSEGSSVNMRADPAIQRSEDTQGQSTGCPYCDGCAAYTANRNYEPAEYQPDVDNASGQNVNMTAQLPNCPHSSEYIIPCTFIAVFPQQSDDTRHAMNIPTTSPPATPSVYPTLFQPVGNSPCVTLNLGEECIANNIYMTNPLHLYLFNEAHRSLNVGPQIPPIHLSSRSPPEPPVRPTATIGANNNSRSNNPRANVRSNLPISGHVGSNRQPQYYSPTTNNTLGVAGYPTDQPIRVFLSQLELGIFQALSVHHPLLANQMMLAKIIKQENEDPLQRQIACAPIVAVINLWPLDLQLFRYYAEEIPDLANVIIGDKLRQLI